MDHPIKLTSFLLVFCLTSALFAQPGHPAKPDSPSTTAANGPQTSPRATMKTFLTAMHSAVELQNEAAWTQVIQCLDLSEVGKDRVRVIAEELRSVIDRLEYINWHTTVLPDAAQVQAQALSTFTYFPSPRFQRLIGLLRPEGKIKLTLSDSGQWRFSADSVAQTRDLYRSLEDLPKVAQLSGVTERSLGLWLRQKIPAKLRGADHELFKLEYWQWIALFVLVLAGVFLDHLVRFCLRAVLSRLILGGKSGPHAVAVRRATRPLGLISAALLCQMLLHAPALPDGALTILLGAARIFVVFAGVWAAWCLTDLLSELLVERATQTETKFDDVLFPMLRKTVKVFIIVFGIVFAADTLDMRDKIMPLLASLGIGGVAFAFAAKDTVENLFGSVALLLDRPFEVGDWVVIGETEGIVEELGFRSTRIRTFYNSQVTVPNANLVRAQVDNYGRRQYRRWTTNIGVQYDTPPEKMIEFVEGIRNLVRTHPHTRKDYFHVYYNQFSDSSLDILLYVFFDVPDWGIELRERERLFIDIVRLAQQVGVSFAFPTRTLHLAGGDPVPHIRVEPAGGHDKDAARAFT